MNTCNNKKWFNVIGLALIITSTSAMALPRGFVYLKDVAPTIVQEMRYATVNNFTGSKVPGYQAGTCILTEQTAKALAEAQDELAKSNYSLKVYDCYRPKTAVKAFRSWLQNDSSTTYKQGYYPNEEKIKLFDNGYIAEYSAHSRGSTVDVTIVPTGSSAMDLSQPQALKNCTSLGNARTPDTSIDMGTGYDCMDPRSHYYSAKVSTIAQAHRKILRDVMHKVHMKPYNKEWWHFTLHREPFPRQYFDFPVA